MGFARKVGLMEALEVNHVAGMTSSIDEARSGNVISKPVDN